MIIWKYNGIKFQICKHKALLIKYQFTIKNNITKRFLKFFFDRNDTVQIRIQHPAILSTHTLSKMVTLHGF